MTGWIMCVPIVYCAWRVFLLHYEALVPINRINPQTGCRCFSCLYKKGIMLKKHAFNVAVSTKWRYRL